MSSTPLHERFRARRTLVVGDVHGCLSELDELLRAAEFVRGSDRLVFTGDLLDRGPDSVGVLRRARELGAECVLGNHEHLHLLAAGWAETSSALSPAHLSRAGWEPLPLTQGDLAWIGALPLWLRLDARWVVVHAGFEPPIPIERQRPDVVRRIRYVDPSGRWAHLDGDGNPPPRSRHWASAWGGTESVAYGHHIHDLAAPRVDEQRERDAVCVGLDTGCCVGGRLTALVLPSRELVQVTSRSPLRPFRFKD